MANGEVENVLSGLSGQNARPNGARFRYSGDRSSRTYTGERRFVMKPEVEEPVAEPYVEDPQEEKTVYVLDTREPKELDGFSLAGFVMSCTVFFGASVLFAVFAFVFSMIGLFRCKKGVLRGSGFAISGIIISSLFVLFFVVDVLFGSVISNWFTSFVGNLIFLMNVG